ncbi:MAG: hypothetical protein FJX46_03045 [Alphaproteobacteria bacterium]|nr:hypothetical protein [Alphaproteobacteria bacterium]
MAGIGFALRKLARRDDLLGIIECYAHSALVSAGPWMFTVLAVGGINLIGGQLTTINEIGTYRIALIYNFAFSLVFSGPLVIVATRYLADLIYTKRVAEAPGMLLAGLGILYLVSTPPVAWFYFSVAKMSDPMRIATIVNFHLVSGIWMVGLYLTALKDFRSITYAFAIGMAASFLGGIALVERFGALGLMGGFDIGLAVILFSLISRVFAEYPYPIQRPFAFLGYFGRYWDLALAGLAYNVAIWIDKWVMWFAPEQEAMGGMISFPDYDSAMFLAYLTIVPALAVFIVSIETDFFEHYQRFYKDIQGHANLDRIRRNHKALIQSLLDSARNVIVLQACIAGAAILVAPGLFDAMGIPATQLGIFRFGVLGALFHVMLLFVGIVLAYFDLRRHMLMLQLLFMVSNGVLSWVTLKMGFAWYGYGYFIATVLTLVVGYAVAAREVARLPYLTFVRNNASLN